MKAKVLKKFKDIEISFQDEDADALRPWMSLNQCFEDFKVHVTDIVHSPVYLA